MRVILLIVVALVLLVGGTVGTIRSLYAPGGCAVAAVEIYGDEPSGSNRVPLRPDGDYGWSTTVTHTRPIAWEERLTLPHAPTIWPNHYPHVLSDGGRTMTTTSDDLDDISFTLPWWQRACGIKAALIRHGWGVAEGDPAGPYEFTVTVDGTVRRRFTLVFE